MLWRIQLDGCRVGIKYSAFSDRHQNFLIQSEGILASKIILVTDRCFRYNKIRIATTERLHGMKKL